MHILLIHQAFASPGQPGGTRHFELAEYLVEQGHRVTVVASQVSYMTGGSTRQPQSGLWTSENLSGVEIRWVKAYTRYHAGFIHRSLGFVAFSTASLLAALSGLKPDIVIGTSPPPLQALTAFVAAKWHRAAYIYEIRDLFWDYVVQTGFMKEGIIVKSARRLDHWLYRRAQRLIVNSPGFIPYLRQRRIPEQRIALIPNSVDTRQFSPALAQKEVWEPYGCRDRFIVLYAGAHGILNNLETLIAAADLLQKEPNICICLMGDGKEKPNLVQQAQRLGLSNVIFLESQPKAAVPAFVASSNVCVATLRNLPVLRTVYPNKVFDYLAAGRPVVLAIDGVIRDLIEEAGAGLYVQPGDAGALAAAISHLYENPDEAESMGARGRAYVVEHFDRRQQAAQLEQLLIAVDSAHRAGRRGQ